LAEVEAGLHGVPLEEVHLHELGAVDTLVDVAGTLALLEALGRPSVFHGPVPLGGGTVMTAHGALGAPAPATWELLRGRPCYGIPEQMETVTPTGALLLAELAEPVAEIPAMAPVRMGYGAGSRRLRTRPNLLRAVLGASLQVTRDPADGPGGWDEVILLETSVDDAGGEFLGRLAELLRSGGALDVWLTPVQMKKGRPGVQLSVLGRPGDEERLLDLLLAEGTSLGVRVQRMVRRVLEREWVSVRVRGERIMVKVGRLHGRPVRWAPEFDDVAGAASRLGLPVNLLMQEAGEAARRSLSGDSAAPPGASTAAADSPNQPSEQSDTSPMT
jgi:uncharacterized protein (TIGR00299 family) protein